MRVFTGIQRLALPDVCPVCLACLIAPPADVCAACALDLRELPSPRCRSCGGALDTPLAVCGECLRGEARPWAAAVSVFPFRGAVREVIHRFKYQGHSYLAPVLARRMAASWQRHGAGAPDVVAPVPLHWFRELRRRYNQAGLLANHIGRTLGVPACDLLRRRRWTSAQTTLDFSSRQANVATVFAARQNARTAGLRVLLVDDVLTTGATLGSASRVLAGTGAASVWVLTAARG